MNRLLFLAVVGVFCASAVCNAEEGKDFPYPTWLNEKDKKLFEQLVSPEAKGMDDRALRKMDLTNQLSPIIKKEIVGPGMDSWLSTGLDVRRGSKVVRFALYVDKVAYDSAKAFWKEEKKSLDELLQEAPPTLPEFCSKLLSLTRSFNDTKPESDQTISFHGAAFNFEDSETKGIGAVVKFNLWDSRFTSTQRVFLYELVENNGDGYFPGKVRPYSYILIGKDFMAEANKKKEEEILNSPRLANRALPRQYDLMNQILAEDDNLTEEEREFAYGFSVDDHQKLKEYQIESISDKGLIEPRTFHMYVPNGSVVTYSDLHRLLGSYFQLHRARGIQGHFRVQLIPHKHGKWEYTKLRISHEAPQ